MLEFIVTIAIFIALVIPVGNYLYHISTGQKHLQIRLWIG